MEDIIKEIFTDLIDDPETAMRSELDRNGLFELADNIKQNGLINPITVRPKGNRYEVVAGHRRLSACKIAGKIKIQCVVRELDDEKTFNVMAAENLERADVDVIDEADFLANFINATGKSVPEVAKQIRRSVQYVETRLTVGRMPDYMKDYLKRGEIKLGVALALLEIENDKIRHLWVDRAAAEGTSVAHAEFWLHDYRVNKSMYDSVIPETPPDAPPSEQKPIMFRCAIDGQEYDCRLFKNVFIYEGNVPIFNAFVSEFSKNDSPN